MLEQPPTKAKDYRQTATQFTPPKSVLLQGMSRASVPPGGIHQGDRALIRKLVKNQKAFAESESEQLQPQQSQQGQMRLVLNGVKPRLELVQLGQDASVPPSYPIPGSDAIYMLLPDKPSIDATIQLFTLSGDQAPAFRQLAQSLLDLMQGRSVQQLRQIITGKPGTGKSRVVEAFLWFAFQWGQSHRIGVTSFMWRAALLISTPANRGLSTSTALGVNPVKGDMITESLEGIARVQVCFKHI